MEGSGSGSQRARAAGESDRPLLPSLSCSLPPSQRGLGTTLHTSPRTKLDLAFQAEAADTHCTVLRMLGMYVIPTEELTRHNTHCRAGRIISNSRQKERQKEPDFSSCLNAYCMHAHGDHLLESNLVKILEMHFDFSKRMSSWSNRLNSSLRRVPATPLPSPHKAYRCALTREHGEYRIGCTSQMSIYIYTSICPRYIPIPLPISIPISIYLSK